MKPRLLSFTEENYLKAIYSLSEREGAAAISTNQIAKRLQTKAPAVSDMLQKLAKKKLVSYEKYKKIELTRTGNQMAILIIRKHRLWEVFLHNVLHFNWDEVHEIAEQLEHIHSEELTSRLEKFLDYPSFDPHGDPIPSANGELKPLKRIALSNMEINEMCQIVGVNDSSPSFLQYLQQVNLGIGIKLKVMERFSFDGSLVLALSTKVTLSVSKKIADNLLVVT